MYTLHLNSSNLLVYLGEQRPLGDAVQASAGLRRACLERVLADLRGRDAPAILMGDLNATDRSDAYHLLRSEFHDAHRAVGWGLGHTFPAYRGRFRGIPILPRQMRIDMIFYDASFKALSCRVVPVHGESDHLPVVARLIRVPSR